MLASTRFSPTIKAIVCLIGVAFLLAGCTSTSTVPRGIAYVVGDRANSPAVDAAKLAAYVPMDLPIGSVVTVTGVSGSPDGVAGEGFTFADLGNRFDNQDELLTARATLETALTSARAKTPEADLLSAIAVGARSIAGVAGGKRLYIADSMLSTTGILVFSPTVLATAPDAVAAAIPESALPDLSSFSVTVIGQANTVPPQSALGSGDRDTLRTIWEKILTRAHAASITYDDTQSTGVPTNGVPAVTPVSPSPLTPISFPSKCTAVIPQDQVRFVADLPTFESFDQASQLLASVAAALQGCTGTVTVSGTTASGRTEQFNRSLGLSRAKAAAALLANDLGVDVSTIVVRGLGTDFAGFVPDRRPDGTQDNAAASRNRTVIVSIG